MGLTGSTALVVTVSDGVSAGMREDLSGQALQEMLTDAGYTVERSLVADEVDDIRGAIEGGAGSFDLLLTTGGTGFGPRDVTPEATGPLLDREAPGLVHLMLEEGLKVTPMAALTRGKAGVVGSTLVVNLPGSPKGATENLNAILGLLPHTLTLLRGDTEHR